MQNQVSIDIHQGDGFVFFHGAHVDAQVLEYNHAMSFVPTPGFWSVWEEHKDELQDRGVSVNKDANGDWIGHIDVQLAN